MRSHVGSARLNGAKQAPAPGRATITHGAWYREASPRRQIRGAERRRSTNEVRGLCHSCGRNRILQTEDDILKYITEQLLRCVFRQHLSECLSEVFYALETKQNFTGPSRHSAFPSWPKDMQVRQNADSEPLSVRVLWWTSILPCVSIVPPAGSHPIHCVTLIT